MKNLMMYGWVLLSIFTACKEMEDDSTTSPKYEEMAAVANRGSASVSMINTDTNQVSSTIPLSGSEPMYVVYVPLKDRLYVGDRAGNKVHIINPQSKAVEGSINVGRGVFHMWADGLGKQLWVSNDVDNTVSVIDLSNNTILKTIEVDLKPHDIFVSKDGSKAYVSVFNTLLLSDKVYMYNTSTFAKTGEVNVGKEPHLFHLSNSNKLFVACQSGELYSLNGNDLSVASNKPFEGAHGIYSSPYQNTLFVTNITGGKIYSINASNSEQNGTALNAAGATPHNIVINETGNKMFVTHSGASANTVSVYSLSGTTLAAGTNITVGTNPFGISYYKREVK